MRRLLVLSLLLGAAACRKDDASSRLEAARAALLKQQPDVALAEYRAVLDLLERDTSPAATLYRARALRGAADLYAFELNDPKRAVEVYRELINLCPEAPETLEGRLRLARLLQHRFRDLRGAIAELTAALARNPPQSAELSYSVARMYFELQDYEQCQLEAGAVVRKYEASPFVDDALYLRGQALAMMEGHRADAARLYQELLERFPGSELEPHVLVELGRLRADAGDPEAAIELWVRALKRHPLPATVQAQIASVRERLRATTPNAVGDAQKAFDWDKVQAPEPRAAKASVEAVGGPAGEPRPAKTSAEAVGGTAAEAQAETKMSAEHAAPAQPSP